MTRNQLVFGIRVRRKIKNKYSKLNFCPQKQGICYRITTVTPRKPCSGLRRIAKMKLSVTYRKARGYISGQGCNNLRKYSHVLIRGGRCRDVPGITYQIIRGKLDMMPLLYLVHGRSRYGMKKAPDPFLIWSYALKEKR